MDGKWTPGPWVVEYKHGTTRIIAGEDVTMCDETYYPWVPENDADWHLIAAAPDLYEALEGMLRHSCVADAGADMKDAEDHAFERQARAALAKARGEA